MPRASCSRHLFGISDSSSISCIVTSPGLLNDIYTDNLRTLLVSTLMFSVILGYLERVLGESVPRLLNFSRGCAS